MADKNPIKGGEGDKVPLSKLPTKEMIMGMKEEKEHTADPAIRADISRDHVSKDKWYYKKLKRMEKSHGWTEDDLRDSVKEAKLEKGECLGKCDPTSPKGRLKSALLKKSELRSTPMSDHSHRTAILASEGAEELEKADIIDFKTRVKTKVEGDKSSPGSYKAALRNQQVADSAKHPAVGSQGEVILPNRDQYAMRNPKNRSERTLAAAAGIKPNEPSVPAKHPIDAAIDTLPQPKDSNHLLSQDYRVGLLSAISAHPTLNTLRWSQLADDVTFNHWKKIHGKYASDDEMFKDMRRAQADARNREPLAKADVLKFPSRDAAKVKIRERTNKRRVSQGDVASGHEVHLPVSDTEHVNIIFCHKPMSMEGNRVGIHHELPSPAHGKQLASNPSALNNYLRKNGLVDEALGKGFQSIILHIPSPSKTRRVK